MFDTHPLIDVLVQRFPRLFRGSPPRVPSDLPPGWAELTGRLFADLDAMLEDAHAQRFEIIQIKEKFAGLRVYWQLDKEATLVGDVHGRKGSQRLEIQPDDASPLFKRIVDRVHRAEEEAAVTCQRCGAQPASRTASGWLVNLCAACAAHKDGRPR